jgi:hypothetical protein
MSRSTRTTSTSAKYSNSTQQRLNSYALAATAAGVGLLALTEPSQAKIIYTRLYKVIGPNQRYLIDLNHDGKPDFAIQNTSHCNIDNTCSALVSAIRYGANGVGGTAGTEFTPPRAYALNAGAKIGPGRGFSGRKMAGAGQTTQANWYNVTNRYLGLKFKVKGQTHYGWARMTVRLGKAFTVTLTGFAYESVSNRAIIAGKTRGPDEENRAEQPNPAGLIAPTPEPVTPGLLAMGAPGLSIWRREE